jgi:D-alanine-D-alanine ligase
MRLDASGIANVIEINPLAGLHPVDSDLPILCRHLGITYANLIADIVQSALERSAPEADVSQRATA